LPLPSRSRSTSQRLLNSHYLSSQSTQRTRSCSMLAVTPLI